MTLILYFSPNPVEAQPYVNFKAVFCLPQSWTPRLLEAIGLTLEAMAWCPPALIELSGGESASDLDVPPGLPRPQQGRSRRVNSRVAQDAPRRRGFQQVLSHIRSMLERGCGCHRSCFSSMQDVQFVEAMTMQIIAFEELHKLDQDKVLFDRFRCLKAKYGTPLRYEIHRINVCEKGYMKLLQVGRDRFLNIRRAACEGQLAPPMDMRYLERHDGNDGPQSAEAMSYLLELYESVAEVLPEDTGVGEIIMQEDAALDLVASVEDEEASAPADLAASGHAAIAEVEEVRFLPPGNVASLWKEHCDVRPEHAVGLRTFSRVYRRHFAKKLKFRRKRQHKVCGICVRHKLIIRNLAGDCVKRKVQTQFYHKHLRSQRADRGVYYSRRAKSRLRTPDSTDGKIHVCVILDGMDQAKFGCPRDERLDQSKEFEGVRPRLHVVGVIAHGYFRQIYVTDPDIPKDSNLTCEILANVLTLLKDMSVPLSASVVLHVQGDNTCRENKNNITMKFVAGVVGFGRIVAGEQEYLITGHTHEDIDQLFGRLARFLLKQHRLEDPTAFVRAISKFMQELGQTTEVWHQCVKLDHVRDWRGWLSHLRVHVQGIGGPGAPHRFRFERRADIPAQENIIAPKHWEGAAAHPQDVILTTWARMSDPAGAPSLKPTLYIPFVELLRLPPLGPGASTARNPMEKKFKDDLMKMAEKIRGAPYHMAAAADWIAQWLGGTQSLAAPAAVDYVAAMGSSRQQAAAVHWSPALDDADPLDASPNALRFVRPAAGRHAPAVQQQPSAKANFLYPTAVHIWSQLMGRDEGRWDEARQQAEDMWSNMSADAAAAFEVEPKENEDDAEDDDVPVLLSA